MTTRSSRSLFDKVGNALRPNPRVVRDDEYGQVIELCERHPLDTVMVHGMLLEHGTAAHRYGGAMWGHFDGDTLVSACWVGANLVPLAATPQALAGFIARGRREGRISSSIVGPAEQVHALWHELEPVWGPAREFREHQPVMVCHRVTGERDPFVRIATTKDLAALVPASISMFTEEVGYSPIAGGNYAPYVQRVANLVQDGRAYVRTENVEGQSTVIFKADIGALSDQVAQIQGVWVHPRLRGLGLAAPAMASVTADIQQRLGATASLYVNDFNERALRAYRRCGYEVAGDFATVLF